MDRALAPRPVCRLGLRLGPLVAGTGTSLLGRAAAIARAAEEAGFDSLWVADRFGATGPAGPSGTGPGTDPDTVTHYEAYSLLGALATRTRSLRLGVLPEGTDRRLPAVVAKIVTTVDILSHGRGCLTLGVAGPDAAGHEDAEADGFDAGDRDLAERLRVCRAVLEDERPEFDGHLYAAHGAFNVPRPVQPGGIPLVVSTGAGRPVPQRVVRTAVAYADALVMDGDAAAVAATGRSAGSHPPGAGRRPFDMLWAGSPADRGATPAAAAQLVRTRLAAGAAGCIVDLSGSHTAETVLRYGPALRQAVDAELGSDRGGPG